MVGKKFTIWTDHSALKYLKTAKIPEGKRMRWLLRLQQYNFEIKHRAGRENKNADALSRLEYKEKEDIMMENKIKRVERNKN